MNLVFEKFAISYFESMNTVLIQELLRYNTLLEVQRECLLDLIAGIQGHKVMTNVLDQVAECLMNNVIP